MMPAMTVSMLIDELNENEESTDAVVGGEAVGFRGVRGNLR